MSARILVVDDVPANVKLLEDRLSAEYFDVLTAYSGAEALRIDDIDPGDGLRQRTRSRRNHENHNATDKDNRAHHHHPVTACGF